MRSYDMRRCICLPSALYYQAASSRHLIHPHVSVSVSVAVAVSVAVSVSPDARNHFLHSGGSEGLHALEQADHRGHQGEHTREGNDSVHCALLLSPDQ